MGIPSCIITLVAFDWQFFRSLYWDKSLRDPIQQVKQRKTDFSLTTFLSFYLASVSFLITKHRSTFFLDFLWFSFQKLVLTQVVACSETIDVAAFSVTNFGLDLFFSRCHLLLKLSFGNVIGSRALIRESNWWFQTAKQQRVWNMDQLEQHYFFSVFTPRSYSSPTNEHGAPHKRGQRGKTFFFKSWQFLLLIIIVNKI